MREIIGLNPPGVFMISQDLHGIPQNPVVEMIFLVKKITKVHFEMTNIAAIERADHQVNQSQTQSHSGLKASDKYRFHLKITQLLLSDSEPKQTMWCEI